MGPANEVVPGEEPERNNENGQVTEDAKPNGSSHAAPESPGEHRPRLCYVIACTIPSMIFLCIGVSIIVADAFEVVEKLTVESLFFFLYLVAFMGMLALFISHGLGRLTLDILEAGDKKQGFSRGGIYVLGSGGMIYQAMNLYAFGKALDDCDVNLLTAKTALALIVSGMQVLFLVKFRLVKINRSVIASFMSRLVLAHMVALNLCVWIRTIVTESLHEIHDSEHGDGHSNGDDHHDSVTHDPHMTMAEHTTQASYHGETGGHGETGTSSKSCAANPLVDIISPYAYPLLIEFSVLAVGLYITIYERCGVKDDPRKKKEEAEEGKDFVLKSHGDTVLIKHDINNSIIYNNTSEGLFVGWLFILLTVIFVIACLYDSYTQHSYHRNYGLAVYGFNLMLVVVCLLACGQAIYRIRVMETFKAVKDPQERREHMLLYLTLSCMIAYKVFCVIAGGVQADAVLIVDGLLSIASGVTTTVYINWYSFNKRLTHPLQRSSKPGRQAIEVIRCLNFALWLVNTFLLKATFAKQPLSDTFGDTAWPIISNIVQPMTILFYFHTMMCASDVIAHLHTWHMHPGEVKPFSHLPGKGNYCHREGQNSKPKAPAPNEATVDVPL